MINSEKKECLMTFAGGAVGFVVYVLLRLAFNIKPLTVALCCSIGALIAYIIYNCKNKK